MRIRNRFCQIRNCIAHINGLILCLYCNSFFVHGQRIAGSCRKIARLVLFVSFHRIGSGRLRCNDCSSRAHDRHLAGRSIHLSHSRNAAGVCDLSVRFSIISFSFSPVRIDRKLLISVCLRYMISTKAQCLETLCRCGNSCGNRIILVVDCSGYRDLDHSDRLIPLCCFFKLKL